MATPLGVALGIATHSFTPIEQNILLQAIFESLAAGILVYDALGSIVFPFFKSKAYLSSRQLYQFSCCCGLWLGALAMAVIGYWV